MAFDLIYKHSESHSIGVLSYRFAKYTIIFFFYFIRKRHCFRIIIRQTERHDSHLPLAYFRIRFFRNNSLFGYTPLKITIKLISF